MVITMITATQVAEWAKSATAQRELPRLIRRLMHAQSATTKIAMPAGDSVSLPGFDGELFCAVEGPWVPKGHSCWELSCQESVTTKANSDFEKRTERTPQEARRERTYVAVTARRWPSKTKWAARKHGRGEWQNVVAYDADDLEH